MLDCTPSLPLRRDIDVMATARDELLAKTIRSNGDPFIRHGQA
ncbi:hypothetical protein [Burkholderia cepacia]|nr:hypothetical protein [Burkholderia cepacia]